MTQTLIAFRFLCSMCMQCIAFEKTITKKKKIEPNSNNSMRLFQLPVPTVAALNGHALAGGMVIACACDVRVAGME